MSPDDIRAFLLRDRASVEEAKRAHRISVYQEGGPEATLRAAAHMFEYARAARPEFPTEADLAADLAHQVAFKKRLIAIGRALSHVRADD